VDLNILYNQTFTRLQSASNTKPRTASTALSPATANTINLNLRNVSLDQLPTPHYWPKLRLQFTSNNDNSESGRVKSPDDATNSVEARQRVLERFMKTTGDPERAASGRRVGFTKCSFNLNSLATSSGSSSSSPFLAGQRGLSPLRQILGLLFLAVSLHLTVNILIPRVFFE
jgi:hypothetical protein